MENSGCSHANQGWDARDPELLDGLRSFPIGKYVIFYVPRSRGIEVVRVLHGARDLKLFFEQEID